MPRGDGTGPAGAGPLRGCGMGRGARQGRGRMGGSGLGSGGDCVCTACGKRVPHERGVPMTRLV